MSKVSEALPGNPIVLTRDQHNISRKNIDPDCLKVMKRLNSGGFNAYLVGGGVRDLLLNKTPKDFDVSTNASPEEVRSLFRNSRIIGRRFKLNHVYFKGGKIIEVSTFRRSSAPDEESLEDTKNTDNLYGDAETDAFRRDLTINGLFYDLSTFDVIDYVGGVEDLRNGVIRIIGNPEERFKEDPVRMIRAVRHAARANFRIDPATHSSIIKCADLLASASSVRVYEEFIKDLRGGSSWIALQLLVETGLLKQLFQTLDLSIESSRRKVWERLDRILPEVDRACLGNEEDMSVGLILALILFRNVSPDLVSKDNEDQDLAVTWGILPAQADTKFDSLIREVDFGPRVKRTKRSKSKFAKSVDFALGNLKVPNKERDRIEQLLISRVVIMGDTFAADSSLLEKSFFEEAIRFAELSSTTKEELEKISEWKEFRPKKRKTRSRQ